MVETITLRPAPRAKTLACSGADSLAKRGRVTTPGYPRPRIISRASPISCSVGMNTRISPKRDSLRIWSTAVTAASTYPWSSPSSSRGEYLISTGNIRPDTSTTGASSKALENFSVSMVAEVMMSFRSRRFRIRFLKIPRVKSILRLRSWASSTIRVSYSLR